MLEGPIYLDNAATTKVDHRVAQVAMESMVEEFGNAGSRTHQFGSRAKAIGEQARKYVAEALAAEPSEVIFTSGATESDNIAILGSVSMQPNTSPPHIITTQIEHKAVLEPIEHLAKLGAEVTFLAPTESGFVSANQVVTALKDNTILVSIMHVNNETGVIQPIDEIADALTSHPTLFHVDAAQGFLKEDRIVGLSRADLISLSAHKVYGPKGIGALVVRSRGDQLPVHSLMFGGGQERGIRPGTLPVHLVAAFGEAVRLGLMESRTRRERNEEFRNRLKTALAPLNPHYLGDQNQCVPNIVSLSLPGVDSEAFMLFTKDLIAISNGSACTSHRYEPSHVLTAMGLDDETRQGAVRISWAHDTPDPNWDAVVEKLGQLL